MKMLRLLKSSAIVTGLALTSGIALADCSFIDGTSALIRTQPLLGGNLTVGRDIALGAEIYRQTHNAATQARISCSVGTYNIATMRNLLVTPHPKSSWAGVPWGGNVYESGVPGIGVVFWFSGTAFPSVVNNTNCGGGTNLCIWTAQTTLAYDMTFLKIGDVSPGTIQGAQLPTINQVWVSSNSLEVMRMNYSGSINIVSRTCSTPDVNVPMGTHKTSEFTGKNSFTPWKDFSIELRNCPAFNGYYQGTGPRWLSDGTSNNLESRKNNVLNYRIDSTRAPINAAQGILSLDPAATGSAAAATGIGLQVGNLGGFPTPLATLRAVGLALQAVEGGNYSIPLKARYIQTEDSVTAGPANATATFTINYY